MNSESQVFLKAAYAYDNAGFTPIPLKGGSKAKRPLTSGRHGIRRHELAILFERGWGEHPFSWERFDALFAIAGGIGLVCGSCSGGLTVLDFDHDESYQRWSHENSPLAARMPIVLTRRGRHCYFRTAVPLPLKRPTFFVGGVARKAGEFMAANCYVVAPPSSHRDGGRYTWLGNEANLSILPTFAFAELGVRVRAINAGSNASALPPKNPNIIGTIPLRRGGLGDLNEGSTGVVTFRRGGVWDLAKRFARRDVPTAYGCRHTCLLKLVRSLKSITGLVGRPAADFKWLIQFWLDEVELRGKARTKDFTDNYQEFQDAWESEGPSSTDEFARLLAPLELHRYDDNRDRIRAICWHFSRSTDDSTFYLSATCLAPYLGCRGVSPQRASTLLKELCDRRELTKIEQSEFKKGKANRYRLGPEFRTTFSATRRRSAS